MIDILVVMDHFGHIGLSPEEAKSLQPNKHLPTGTYSIVSKLKFYILVSGAELNRIIPHRIICQNDYANVKALTSCSLPPRDTVLPVMMDP